MVVMRRVIRNKATEPVHQGGNGNGTPSRRASNNNKAKHTPLELILYFLLVLTVIDVLNNLLPTMGGIRGLSADTKNSDAPMNVKANKDKSPDEERNLRSKKSDESKPREQERPPILFVRFHDTPGLNVCNLMKNSQTMVDLTDTNGKLAKYVEEHDCSPPPFGRKFDVKEHAKFQTCSELQEYTKDKNGKPFGRNNFLSVEVPLKESLPCEGKGHYRVFAMISTPMERIYHNIRQGHVTQEEMMKWAKEKTPHTPNSYLNGYPVVNNFMIRMLLGRDRYSDLRPIDEDDYLHAMELLVLKFDAVLPVGSLGHQTIQFKLRDMFPEVFQGILSLGGRYGVGRAPNPTTTEEFRNLMEEENKYDRQLFERMYPRAFNK